MGISITGAIPVGLVRGPARHKLPGWGEAMPGPDTTPRPRHGPPAHPGGPVVDIADPEGRLAAPALGWLIARARDAVMHLEASGEVRVRVVADAEMAAAHEEFAGVPGTTDVLTFDLADPDVPPNINLDGRCRVLDTDILVCADEAARQAASRGYAVERELLLYIVHGVLHCLGYDDHDEAAAAAMHAREDGVLTAIGVGATYRGEP